MADHDWWTQGSLLETHPVAHVIDGSAADLLVRGPWVAPSWRDAAWKRLAWAGAIGTGFELVQIQEFHGSYPGKYALADILATIVGAAITEGVVSLLKRHPPPPATESNP